MEYVFPDLDYNAFLSRAEFGSHEETVDHVNRQIFRSYQGHRPGEVPNELFKLRYDVYCVERAFLKADDSYDGLEFDDYDDCSMHFAAYTLIMMPLGWWLAHEIGVDGLVWAVIIASLVSSVLLTGRFVRVARRLPQG